MHILNQMQTLIIYKIHIIEHVLIYRILNIWNITTGNQTYEHIRTDYRHSEFTYDY